METGNNEAAIAVVVELETIGVQYGANTLVRFRKIGHNLVNFGEVILAYKGRQNLKVHVYKAKRARIADMITCELRFRLVNRETRPRWFKPADAPKVLLNPALLRSRVAPLRCPLPSEAWQRYEEVATWPKKIDEKCIFADELEKKGGPLSSQTVGRIANTYKHSQSKYYK